MLCVYKVSSMKSCLFKLSELSDQSFNAPWALGIPFSLSEPSPSHWLLSQEEFLICVTCIACILRVAGWGQKISAWRVKGNKRDTWFVKLWMKILLKVCVMRKFCSNLYVKRNHDPPLLLVISFCLQYLSLRFLVGRRLLFGLLPFKCWEKTAASIL